MATVESSDIDVVVELGVPLSVHCQSSVLTGPHLNMVSYGASPGVSNSDGGGGRLMSVGALPDMMLVVGSVGLWWSSFCSRKIISASKGRWPVSHKEANERMT